MKVDGVMSGVERSVVSRIREIESFVKILGEGEVGRDEGAYPRVVFGVDEEQSTTTWAEQPLVDISYRMIKSQHYSYVCCVCEGQVPRLPPLKYFIKRSQTYAQLKKKSKEHIVYISVAVSRNA